MERPDHRLQGQRGAAGSAAGGFASMGASGQAHAVAVSADPDGEIAAAVRRELAADSMTRALALDVAVSDGFVRLSGSVPGLEQAEAAEEVAYRVAGVVAAVADVTAEGDSSPQVRAQSRLLGWVGALMRLARR